MKWVVINNEPKFRTDSKNVPRLKGAVLMDGPDLPVDEVSVVNGVVVANQAVQELKAEYKSMDDGVVLDAAPVFKTTNRESMLAFVDSYQLRIMVPEYFVSMGLLAEVTIGSFQVGDVLDTAEKVKDYHALILVDLDTKRNTRIGNYINKKTELGL